MQIRDRKHPMYNSYAAGPARPASAYTRYYTRARVTMTQCLRSPKGCRRRVRSRSPLGAGNGRRKESINACISLFRFARRLRIFGHAESLITHFWFVRLIKARKMCENKKNIYIKNRKEEFVQVLRRKDFGDDKCQSNVTRSRLYFLYRCSLSLFLPFSTVS